MTENSKITVYGQWSQTPEVYPYEKTYGIEPMYKQGTHPLYERLYK